jgi:hypothetical protein
VQEGPVRKYPYKSVRAPYPSSLSHANASASSLLITLAILRSLATECRRDIALISPALVASVGTTVGAVPGDLEVVARAASVVSLSSKCRPISKFLSVYSLDHIYGRPPDRNGQQHDARLHFGSQQIRRTQLLRGTRPGGSQPVNGLRSVPSGFLKCILLRTRLIGFAALTGALNSEALYNDSVQFRAQVSVMMRPILGTVFQTPIHVLEQQ